jgi:hypothetical protein
MATGGGGSTSGSDSWPISGSGLVAARPRSVLGDKVEAAGGGGPTSRRWMDLMQSECESLEQALQPRWQRLLVKTISCMLTCLLTVWAGKPAPATSKLKFLLFCCTFQS